MTQLRLISVSVTPSYCSACARFTSITIRAYDRSTHSIAPFCERCYEIMANNAIAHPNLTCTDCDFSDPQLVAQARALAEDRQARILHLHPRTRYVLLDAIGHFAPYWKKLQGDTPTHRDPSQPSST